MTKEELRIAVGEAIEDKLKDFWVDREQHYAHHKFIDKWMKWSDEAEKTVWATIVKTVVLFVLGLIALGALLKFKGLK